MIVNIIRCDFHERHRGSGGGFKSKCSNTIGCLLHAAFQDGIGIIQSSQHLVNCEMRRRYLRGYSVQHFFIEGEIFNKSERSWYNQHDQDKHTRTRLVDFHTSIPIWQKENPVHPDDSPCRCAYQRSRWI